MRLDTLLQDLAAVPAGADTIDIAGLTADSREVAAGSLFAALPGSNFDGALFVPQAIANGACAVLAGGDADIPLPDHIPLIRVRDPRRLLALAAARFFGAQPEHEIAVTGTSGKTSVAEFTRQILALLGARAASLGTIGLVTPDGADYGSLTTPDPVSLHRRLADLAGRGITHLAFEASSHGLQQRRLDGVQLAAGAFTNLGRDHLDYHDGMEAYFVAKLRLFDTLLSPGRVAVVNVDDAASGRVLEVAEARGLEVMTTGRAGRTIRLESIRQDGFSQELTATHAGKTLTATLALIGTYQVSNALVAAGLAMALGEDFAAVLGTFSRLRGVRGRLEVVARHNGGTVIIDYAHKPEALDAALRALRPFASGRLTCLFGCGGDRDRGKRPVMGAIASDLADTVIVTDDNPRGEPAARVRAEILAAVPAAREIGDRGEAIRTAVSELTVGDVLLVAGKGHETGQIVGDRVLEFSDHDAVAAAVAEDPCDG